MTSTDLLNSYLVDTYALLAKTHAFHWNVRGEQFFNLHKLFEEQYEDLFKATDELAERIRALNEFPTGGIKAYARDTSINDPEPDIDAGDMLDALIEDHEKMARRGKEGIKVSTQAGDDATADMFIGRVQHHEKQAWMMRSMKNS